MKNIDTFIFDLDNTLYPAACHLFKEIDAKMTQFVMDHIDLPYDQARKLQKDLYVSNGTTLSGLMERYGTEPKAFLDYVHDIDLSPLDQNHALRDAINMLDGRKLIFTNGSVDHARRVASKIGVWECFEGTFDIVAANYHPKPYRATYDKFLTDHDVDPTTAIMFEDMAENLRTAKDLGMQTVLVQTDSDWAADEPSHKRPAAKGFHPEYVDHATDDLTAFLRNWA